MFGGGLAFRAYGPLFSASFGSERFHVEHVPFRQAHCPHAFGELIYVVSIRRPLARVRRDIAESRSECAVECFRKYRFGKVFQAETLLDVRVELRNVLMRNSHERPMRFQLRDDQALDKIQAIWTRPLVMILVNDSRQVQVFQIALNIR